MSRVRELASRMANDLKHLRNIETYAIATLMFLFAALTPLVDGIDKLRWAVVLAGLGLLVFRATRPDGSPPTNPELLHDRSAFEVRPFARRLDRAREVWIFAPSAINLLSQQHCDALRTTVLARPGGKVHVVVLDPDQPAAVELTARQLDDTSDYQLQRLDDALGIVLSRLGRMSAWPVAGKLECRVLGLSPGFSLVAIDPTTSHGVIIVEFHAFYNEATMHRMHLELTPVNAPQWYGYWSDQFRRIWRSARPVAP